MTIARDDKLFMVNNAHSGNNDNFFGDANKMSSTTFYNTVFYKLFVNKVGFYTLLIVILAFNLSSHTFAYWPGDSWWLRSAYWVLYMGLSLSCIFGFFYALSRMTKKYSQHILFFVAILLSWIPFGLAITMLDIATARPEISYVINELQNTGFLPTLLPVRAIVKSGV